MKAAQQNNSDAQCEIGNCYANGIGTSANVNEAFYWWIKSANAGNREAQFKAGLCYRRGIGVDKNPELASKLLMTSASQGYQPAQEFIYKINETMNRK